MIDHRIRVLVVDHNAHIRRVIADVLAYEEDLCLVGETSDGEEALHVATALSPHVILLDMCIPGLNGLDAARRLRAYTPSPAVLVMAEMDDHEYINSARQAGANGFILKERLTEEMATALRAISQPDFTGFRHSWNGT